MAIFQQIDQESLLPHLMHKKIRPSAAQWRNRFENGEVSSFLKISSFSSVVTYVLFIHIHASGYSDKHND
jgi:hypothetical protein